MVEYFRVTLLYYDLYPWHAQLIRIDFRFIHHFPIQYYLFQPAGRLT